MKRGLVVLDPVETSPAAFAARLDTVRGRLRESGAQVALIYGDVSRSGDINYLTNLCLYWNEAILAVPLQGKLALITKLSKRVQPWMRRTSILEDIRSGPRLAAGVGRLLDERIGGRERRIALINMSWWPSDLVDELRAALPQAELQDLGAAVRDSRLLPSAEEWSLLQSGAQLLDEAMVLAWALGGSPRERICIAVRGIRRAGFQDATVSCGKLQDGSEFEDVTAQYRYVWLRQSRPRGGPLANTANRALREALGAARSGATEAQLARLAASRAGEGCRLTLSCIPHPDIEMRGLFRSDEDTERPLKEGEVVCIMLSLAGEAGVLPAAETVRITRDGAIALCGPESA